MPENILANASLKAGQFPNPDDAPAPSWWPQLFFNLHFPKLHWPGPGPVNLPAEVSNLLANLHIHTFSYYMDDQKAAQTIRAAAECQMIKSVQVLSAPGEAGKTRKTTA
jgi:hypothetical protein